MNIKPDNHISKWLRHRISTIALLPFISGAEGRNIPREKLKQEVKVPMSMEKFLSGAYYDVRTLCSCVKLNDITHKLTRYMRHRQGGTGGVESFSEMTTEECKK